MVQWGARWAGPVNFGVHVALRRGGPHYIDIHLPYTVVSIGNIWTVEYPHWWRQGSRDISTGVRYDRSNERPDSNRDERVD